MTASGLSRCLTAALVAFGSGGCALIVGPACLAQQHRAHVATITGEATPGVTWVREVEYGRAGSQNDLRFTWTGQKDAVGPRLRAFATRIECDAFDPNASYPRGSACSPAGSIGSFMRSGDLVQSSITISHGRGNPEQLGPSARYKLWIVADPRQPASFTIEVTSFYGPDC